MENILIAANHFGYSVKTNHLFSNEVFFADLEFKKTHSEFFCVKYNSIFSRKTNQKPYLKKTIPQEICFELKNLSKEYNVDLHWVENRKKISEMAEFIGKHDIILWEEASLRKNLLRMLRFGKEKNLDGLHIDSLELGIKKYLFSPMIKLADSFNFFWKIMGFNSKLHTKNNIKKSGAICLLTVSEKHNPMAYIRGGRAMQALWISLSQHDLHMQPIFGTITLIIN